MQVFLFLRFKFLWRSVLNKNFINAFQSVYLRLSYLCANLMPFLFFLRIVLFFLCQKHFFPSLRSFRFLLVHPNSKRATTWRCFCFLIQDLRNLWTSRRRLFCFGRLVLFLWLFDLINKLWHPDKTEYSLHCLDASNNLHHGELSSYRLNTVRWQIRNR